MTKDSRRITLVSRHKNRSERSWELSSEAAGRIVLLDSFTMLRSTLLSPLVKTDSDVERIICDRTCSEGEYLGLLTELPLEFTGDVIMIRDDNTGFLNATARRGDRVLYALSADDTEFYLETQRLVLPTPAMQSGILQFRPRIVAVGNEAMASLRSNPRETTDVRNEDDARSRGQR